MKRNDGSASELANLAVVAIEEKKGIDIVQIDLRGIHNSTVDFFVICHASSVTQAEAIADEVEKMVKLTTGLNPKHVEGKQLREWILIDYFDVVVHIFLEPIRGFYRLEELWADGIITRIEEKNQR
jgi:ribosome-associated protein